MQAAAKKEAEEKARAKAAAEEQAKVDAQRRASEQARLNLLGLEDRITEYQKKLETELSNSEKYSIEQALEKLLA